MLRKHDLQLFKYFIIFQPVLDMLIYFSLTYMNVNLRIGIGVRVLFMALTLLYIFSGRYRWKKWITGYIILLFFMAGISFLMNYLTKPSFFLFPEAQFYVKAVYYPVMFCGIFTLFLTRERKSDVRSMIYSAASVAMLIVSLSLFTSIVTNTANSTYTYSKSGYTGWFFAGNELSAIIAICFPLTIIFAIRKTETARDFIYWLPALLLAISSLFVGTKVSFLAVLLTIAGTFIITPLHWLLNRWRRFPLSPWKIMLFQLLLLAVFAAVIPVSPAYENISGDYASINEQIAEEEIDEELKAEEQLKSRENRESAFLQSLVVQTILSSRNVYFQNIYFDYVDAGLMHKWFGLGYAGFYEQNPKLIEMDFFDLFFSFGIAGFTVVVLPVLILAFSVVKSFFTGFWEFFEIENILLIFSCLLGFGVAFFAGHVLYAPAVSIYLSMASVLLIQRQSGQEKIEFRGFR